MSRRIMVGRVPVGGGAPIAVQSMCNTRTDDPQATLAQIQRLVQRGCAIVRVTLPTAAAVAGFREICAESPLPVVADIHFDWRLAVAAMENGAAAVRVNPGNMPDAVGIRNVARCAAENGCAVRVGVNMGSLSPAVEKELGRTAAAMTRSALEYLELFQECGCSNLKVSLKSSDIRTTVEACREFHRISDWPLHLGVTEAGTPAAGVIKSAVGIGALLLEGIGDTIRVSLTAPPEEEVTAAYRILDALGLRPGRPEVVACPTCGRTRIDLIPMAEAVEAEVNRLLSAGKSIAMRKIAVMGCVVNGPGEASDADVGIAGGDGNGVLFRKGQRVATLPEAELLPALLEEIRRAAQ